MVMLGCLTQSDPSTSVVRNGSPTTAKLPAVKNGMSWNSTKPVVSPTTAWTEWALASLLSSMFLLRNPNVSGDGSNAHTDPFGARAARAIVYRPMLAPTSRHTASSAT